MTTLRPDDHVRLPSARVDLAINFSLTRLPDLVAPERLLAQSAYRRFADQDQKATFRHKLIAGLTDALTGVAPSAAVTDFRRTIDGLLCMLRTDGAVTFADLVNQATFRNLVRRYDKLIDEQGSRSFIHQFVDLRRASSLLTDGELSPALLHPLIVMLISLTVGGAVRIVDARAKDAEPLSVLAQDNMLHIDDAPFTDEYKILVAWRSHECRGPAGQNFTYLPGTNKLARNCLLGHGAAFSTENQSIFTTRPSVNRLLAAQQRVLSRSHPTVIEITGSERPLTTVFAAGSLVHHRFRTTSGKSRSAVIIAFHRAIDDPGQLMTDSDDRAITSLRELLIRGSSDEVYEDRFLDLLFSEAHEVADLLSSWTRSPNTPIHFPVQGCELRGARFDQWLDAVTNAPSVELIKEREAGIPFGELIPMARLIELLLDLMHFDKHGRLDLILYADNHEQRRKWARNMIRELPPDRMEQRLSFWASELGPPTLRDYLTPVQLREMAQGVCSRPATKACAHLSAEWSRDLAGIGLHDAKQSINQLLEDLAEAIIRCENMPSFVSTSLFIFWAVETAYTLDGSLDGALRASAARLLRHYSFLSVNSLAPVSKSGSAPHPL